MQMLELARLTASWVLSRLHLKDERAATAVEYGVMVALIAVGIIAAVTFLRDELRSLFNFVGSSLKNAR